MNHFGASNNIIVNDPGKVRVKNDVRLYVVNKSSVVSNNEVRKIVEACRILIKDVSKYWNVQCPSIFFIEYGHASHNIPSDSVVFIVDTKKDIPIYDNVQKGIYAYHYMYGRNSYGYVFAKSILNNGGVTLYYSDGINTRNTVACAVFHELVEVFFNPNCNKWWINYRKIVLDNNGKKVMVNDVKTKQEFYPNLVAVELCDPVQYNIIVITLRDGTRVGLCDFILPSWSKLNGKRPFNYMNTLPAPFTIDKNGYAICRDSLHKYKFRQGCGYYVEQ